MTQVKRLVCTSLFTVLASFVAGGMFGFGVKDHLKEPAIPEKSETSNNLLHTASINENSHAFIRETSINGITYKVECTLKGKLVQKDQWTLVARAHAISHDKLMEYSVTSSHTIVSGLPKAYSAVLPPQITIKKSFSNQEMQDGEKEGLQILGVCDPIQIVH